MPMLGALDPRPPDPRTRYRVHAPPTNRCRVQGACIKRRRPARTAGREAHDKTPYMECAGGLGNRPHSAVLSTSAALTTS